MKTLVILAALLLLMGSMYAQRDSSFVSIYTPNISLHPIWGAECCDLGAGNVFLDYEGRPVMQSWMVFNSDPPPGSGALDICSPFVVFSQTGQYLQTIVPSMFLEGFRIEKTGDGGYLAFSLLMYHFVGNLMRLDANFNPVQDIELSLDSGLPFSIQDVIQYSGQFIARGYSYSERGIVLAGFNLTGAEIWHRSFIAGNGNGSTLGLSSSGNIYCHVGNKILITNSSGDSLAFREITSIAPRRIFEKNDNYYAVECSYNLIKVFDLGMNAINTAPQMPVLEIPVRNGIPQFSVINTSDGGFAFLVQSAMGEVQKYDAAFNLQWALDNVDYERISNQQHPLIELDNGDFLYACGISTYQNGLYPDQFALVRITSEGVPVEDELVQPATRLKLGPNPFNNELTVELKSTVPSRSMIRVYNIKGQLVEEMAVTDGKLSWKPNNLTAGIYVLNLLQDEVVVETRKITHIK